MTSLTKSREELIEETQKCLSAIKSARKAKWRELHLAYKETPRWRFWLKRFTGDLGDFKKWYNQNKVANSKLYVYWPETLWGVDYGCIEELLKFAQSAEPAARINVTKDDYMPVLKWLPKEVDTEG